MIRREISDDISLSRGEIQWKAMTTKLSMVCTAINLSLWVDFTTSLRKNGKEEQMIYEGCSQIIETFSLTSLK
jgi:hypothetical protein